MIRLDKQALPQINSSSYFIYRFIYRRNTLIGTSDKLVLKN